MKTFRMIVGIVCLVLSLVIMFQSCAAGIVEGIENSGGVSGAAGLMLAIFMIVAGIISIAGRKSFGATITAACFYLVGGIIGIANTGVFSDLMIWGALALIVGAEFVVTAIIQKSQER